MRGLYIHIPFCIKKCKYCDFTSFTECEGIFDEYVKKICMEMQEYRGEEINTIFIGGGTPSLLSIDELKKMIECINNTFVLKENAEFTIETNPKTLTHEKLSAIRELGVNRISIGVQSFNDEELKKIGRIHDAGDAEDAIIMAKEAGFSNINIDLMFSLPGQTLESFKNNLNKTINLGITHISCYSLILEEGTPLFEEYEKNMLNLPDEETDRAIYQFTCEELKKNGYEQYEISNFSKKGYECKHNLKYWDCDEYIGIGVAAHSYYKGVRFFNTNSLDIYMQENKREYEELTIDDKIKEFVIMGFRKTKGISKKEFFERFKKEFSDVYSEQTEKFKNIGLLEESEEFICLTEEGINVSNSVLCEFV